jgi:hypothetical protein
LSVASRSIICRCRKQRHITNLRAIYKSRYFAITEVNNSFIIYLFIFEILWPSRSSTNLYNNLKI